MKNVVNERPPAHDLSAPLYANMERHHLVDQLFTITDKRGLRRHDTVRTLKFESDRYRTKIDLVRPFALGSFDAMLLLAVTAMAKVSRDEDCETWEIGVEADGEDRDLRESLELAGDARNMPALKVTVTGQALARAMGYAHTTSFIDRVMESAKRLSFTGMAIEIREVTEEGKWRKKEQATFHLISSSYAKASDPDGGKAEARERARWLRRRADRLMGLEVEAVEDMPLDEREKRRLQILDKTEAAEDARLDREQARKRAEGLKREALAELEKADCLRSRFTFCLDPVMTRSIVKNYHYAQVSLESARVLKRDAQKLLLILLSRAIDPGKARVFDTEDLRWMLYGEEDPVNVRNQRARTKKDALSLDGLACGSDKWRVEEREGGRLYIYRPAWPY